MDAPRWRLFASIRGSRSGPLDWKPDRVPPLGPGPVVVPHLAEAEQIREREPGVRRALSDPAVHHRVGVALEPVLLLVERAELAGRAEGVGLGIHRPRPG